MPRKIGDIEFLTTGEAADELGIDSRTMRNWVGKNGKEIPHFVENNGRLYFPATAIQSMVEQRIAAARPTRASRRRRRTA